MRTRKRGSHTRKSWVSPRKIRKADYAPLVRTEDSDHQEEEDEENSEELRPGSVDKSDPMEGVRPDEQPAETREEHTKDFTIDFVSIVSKRKPKLILHRLKGDFHHLLNNVVLQQNGRCMPTEAQSEEKTDLSDSDTPGPVENSEPQEERSLHSTDHENSPDEGEFQEDAIAMEDKRVCTSLEGIMDVNNEVENDASSFQINLELEDEEDEDTSLNAIIQDSVKLIERSLEEDNPCTASSDAPATAHTGDEEDVLKEPAPADTINPDSAQPIESSLQKASSDSPATAHSSDEEEVMKESTPADTISHDSAQLIERSLQEDNPCTASSDAPAAAHTGDEEDVMKEPAPADTISQDSAQPIERSLQKASSDSPATAHSSDEEEVMKESTPADTISQDSAQLIERPQEDNLGSVLVDPSTTSHKSTEVEVMDLEELKREKIKLQITVLKLQEEYYSLQLQKLKQ